MGAGANCEKLSAAVEVFLSSSASSRRHLMSPEAHRARAKVLREHNSKSRAAELHDLAARAIESKGVKSRQ
jgi:hypothetical protein